MSDHRIDVYESAENHTEYLREGIASDEGFDCLDFEVFKSTRDPESYKVEILLTCGGPTVQVLIDERDNVEFYHSWGMDKRGNDCKKISLWGDDAAEWLSWAQGLAECY